MADNARLMMDRHNEVVSDNDFVIMVGDLSASLRGREEHFSQLLQCLRGRKILVRGNHDHCQNQFYLDAGFESIHEWIKIDKTFICHYPCFPSKYSNKHEKRYISLLKSMDCTTIIHGHIHNKDPNEIYDDSYFRLNACVDFEPNNFYPQEIKDKSIIKYFSEL